MDTGLRNSAGEVEVHRTEALRILSVEEYGLEKLDMQNEQAAGNVIACPPL